MRACLLICVLCTGCLPRVGGLLDGGADAGPVAEHCSDGVLGDGESDLDCGGECPGCGDAQACTNPSDCASRVCEAATCRPAGVACAPAFAGCASFTDATADGAERSITFPATGGNRYAPNCLRIRLGQTVTIVSSGEDFSEHPLDQACGPTSGALIASSGARKTFTPTTALGVYGFFCDRHGSAAGGGMAGAIEVVP